jgi:glutathione S-transferase
MSSPDPTIMTLYYFPRACSLAVHIILEEAGLPYDTVLVNLNTKAQKEPEYLAVNPGGRVPALLVGDRLLTETQAILTYLGDLIPEKNLLPRPGDFNRYRAHEMMNFLSSSLHVYIRSIFRSSAYGGESAAGNEAVGRQGVINLAGAIREVESRLEGKQYALGDEFSVVDAYLFIMYLWTGDDRISSVPERPAWDAVAERVWQRPSTKVVVAREREFRPYPIPEHWKD